ncbi:MAG: two-component regulator propeller domain-containing protein, partial [Bacteroidota bacterium]
MILLCCLLGGYAQAITPKKPLSQLLLQTWEQSNGLPHNSVSAVRQTQDGYIWIGTNNGLARFDGIKFKTFYKGDDDTYALRSNRIRTLYEASDGTLWVGTLGGGITSIQKGRFRTFTTRHGLSDNSVLAITQTQDGTLWVGTAFGLSHWDGVEWKTFNRKDGLPSERIKALITDPNTPNALWIGTENGLCRFEGGRIEKSDLALPDPDVTTLLAASDSVLWIGTPHGLAIHNLLENKLRVIDQASGLSDEFITTLYQDAFGTDWIGTQNGGFYRLSGNKLDHLGTQNDLPSNHVNTIFEDHEGSIWLGMDRGGLAKLREGKFDNFGKQEGLTAGRGNCVLQTDNALWIGTPNGLFRKQGDQFEHFLKGKEVRSLLKTGETLLIGTSKEGLYQFEEGQFRTLSAFTPDWIGEKVTAMANREGFVLIAGEKGLGQYSPKSKEFVLLIPKEEYANSEVQQIFTLSKENTNATFGHFWIATNGGGVYKYDGSLHSFTITQGLPSNVTYCFQPLAKDSIMFVGTESGLAAIKGNVVQDLSTRMQVLSSGIYGMAVDGSGKIWMSTNQGVLGTNPRELLYAETPTYDFYDEASGMRSSDCAFGMQPALAISADRIISIPTSEGLSQLDLREILLNDAPPKQLIHTLVVDGEPRDVRLISEEQILQYRTDQNRFEFLFDVLSFEAPQRLKVRYLLEDFEEEWHETSGERQAIYTNLPTGEFKFRVMAANADGIWNTSEATLNIKVEPYLHETSYFRWIVGILSVLILGSTVFLIFGRLQRQNERLEQAVNKRTKKVIAQNREIREQADEIKRLDKISRIINQEVEFERLFSVILRQGVKLFEGAERGFFLLFDHKTFEFQLIQHYGFPKTLEPSKNVSFSQVINYCNRGELLKEEIYFIDNDDGSSLCDLPPSNHSLVLPLMLNDTLEALVFFEYDRQTSYKDMQTKRVLRFKELAVTAFDKARYMQQIGEKNEALSDSLKKLSDSIQYAQRIQESIMPTKEKVMAEFADAFILYRPRDVVSGDFYWAHREGSKLFLAAIDCTGHGVPGAFMTVMANSVINHVIVEQGLQDPGEILHAVDAEIETIFSVSTDKSRRADGMDMALVVIDSTTNTIEFAGAKNPLYYVRDEKIHRIKGSKYPIGNSDRYKRKEFVTHQIDIQPKDTYYIFTDGLPDQFGGEEGDKFLSRRFRDLLEEYNYLKMSDLGDMLDDAFLRWKGDRDQT